MHLALACGWLAFISSLDAFFDVSSLCASHARSSLTSNGSVQLQRCFAFAVMANDGESPEPQQVIVDANVTDLR